MSDALKMLALQVSSSTATSERSQSCPNMYACMQQLCVRPKTRPRQIHERHHYTLRQLVQPALFTAQCLGFNASTLHHRSQSKLVFELASAAFVHVVWCTA